MILLPENEGGIYNINCAWNAVTDNNSDATLTIFNFTDNNQSVAAPQMQANLNYDVPITSPAALASPR